MALLTKKDCVQLQDTQFSKSIDELVNSTTVMHPTIVKKIEDSLKQIKKKNPILYDKCRKIYETTLSVIYEQQNPE